MAQAIIRGIMSITSESCFFMNTKYLITGVFSCLFSMASYAMNPEFDETMDTQDEMALDNGLAANDGFFLATTTPEGLVIGEELELMDDNELSLEQDTKTNDELDLQDKKKPQSAASKKRKASSKQKKINKKQKARVFSCGICSLNLKRKAHYLAHKKFHASQHSCSECKHGFNSKELLKNHACFRYRCDNCHDAFKSLILLGSHRKKAHSIENSYSCDECPKAFSTSAEMKAHKKDHHYVCSCSKSFSTPLAFSIHQHTHNSSDRGRVGNLELGYECLLCHKIINTKKLFLAHVQKELHNPGVIAEYEKAYIANAIKEKNVSLVDAQGNTPLILACKYADLDAVKQIIALGADIAASNTAGFTGFAYAIIAGNKLIIEELVRQGFIIDNQGDHNSLILAVRMLDYPLVKYFLEHGANVDVQDNNGMTPLMYATRLCELDITRLLLKAGASVDKQRHDGKTALAFCAQRHNITMVRELLAHNADVAIQDKKGKTPLINAIKNHCKYLIADLLKANAPLYVKTKAGITPILLAAKKRRHEILCLLLKKKEEDLERAVQRIDQKQLPEMPDEVWELIFSNFDSMKELADLRLVSKDFAQSVDNERLLKTVLKNQHESQSCLNAESFIKAAAMGNEIAVKAFLRLGVDVNAASKSYHGQTALISAIKGKHQNIVKLLLEAGAGIMVKDSHIIGPLFHACAHEDKTIARMVIPFKNELKDSVSEITTNQSLALAIIDNQVQAFKKIMESQDFKLTPAGKLICMGLAAANGNVEIIDLLFQIGYDHCLQNNIHISPIHIAAFNGHLQAVQRLIERGMAVRSNVRDNSLLQVAVRGGHVEVVGYLLSQLRINPATALDLAQQAVCEGHKKVLKVFVNLKLIDINQRDQRGITLLMLAAGHGHHNIVRYLLKMEAPVNVVADDGTTALNVAADRNYQDIYDLLIAHGAVIYDANLSPRFTTLHPYLVKSNILACAAKNNNISLLKQLLAK